MVSIKNGCSSIVLIQHTKGNRSNNAGTTEFISFKNLEAADLGAWERIFRVNVIGAFQMARASARAMELTSGKGHIVNVSSIAGLNATGSSIPYAASKAALNNITISLARTLAPTIRVNAVAPGFITGRWLEDGLGELDHSGLYEWYRQSLEKERGSE